MLLTPLLKSFQLLGVLFHDAAEYDGDLKKGVPLQELPQWRDDVIVECYEQ